MYDESENEVESENHPKRDILVEKRSFFARFTKIKISQQLLGVGSSALDMFQMTFQFVQIRGVFIIRTFFPYDVLYTPSEKLKNQRKNRIVIKIF